MVLIRVTRIRIRMCSSCVVRVCHITSRRSLLRKRVGLILIICTKQGIGLSMCGRNHIRICRVRISGRGGRVCVCAYYWAYPRVLTISQP